MFDTIKIKAHNITIPKDNLNLSSTQSTSYLDEESGEIRRKYEIEDTKIARIIYYEYSKILQIELSIPKFLFGNNVEVITNAGQINDFFLQLNERLQSVLGISVNKNQWELAGRLDVCWNFNVGDQVSEYIRLLSMKRLPYLNTVLWNHGESIEFKNKSSRTLLYDKKNECSSKNESAEVIDAATGILRLEINTSDYQINKYSDNRQAMIYLTKEFFAFITGKVIEQLELPQNRDKIDYTWLQMQNISHIETFIGFSSLVEEIQETMLRQLYSPQTWTNRKKLIKQLDFPSITSLQKLNIDYDKLS